MVDHIKVDVMKFHKVEKLDVNQESIFDVIKIALTAPTFLQLYSRGEVMWVHLDPGIRPARYQNLENGRISSSAEYRGMNTGYTLVSGQKIWPDVEFASVSGRIPAEYRNRKKCPYAEFGRNHGIRSKNMVGNRVCLGIRRPDTGV